MPDLITFNPTDLPEPLFEDFLKRVAAPDKMGRFLEPTEKIFEHARKLWRPRGILRQISVDSVEGEMVSIGSREKSGLTLAMGFSSRFLKTAHQVMVGVYSIGDALRQAGIEAATRHCHLDSYLYDLIGLTVLEQTGKAINHIVEKTAAKKNWGVGPFLSPGSVHGWDLAEQKTLCSILPLHEIGVTVTDSAVLIPFHSVSFIIGLGPDYDDKTVGSTCQVCSRRESCTIRKTSGIT